MISEKQLAANQANAQKSTGPKTPEGKAISAANAITHGSTISDTRLAATLDDEMTGLRQVFAAYYAVENELESSLTDQLAMADIRMKRCWREEAQIITVLSERAQDLWEIDREADVAEIALKLAKQPNATYHKLLTTLHGCKWLIASWKAAIARMDANFPFDEAVRSRFLDLLGIPGDDRVGLTKLDPAPGSPQTPSEKAREVAHTELTRLGQLCNGPLLRANEKARGLAIECVPVNPNANLRLTMRYEREAASKFHKLMKLLDEKTRSRDCPAHKGKKPKNASCPPVPVRAELPQKPATTALPPQMFTTLAPAAPPTPTPKPAPAAPPKPEPTIPKVIPRSEAPGLNRHQRKALARKQLQAAS